MQTEFKTLTAAIEAYKAGTHAFVAIKECDWDCYGGEAAVIELTYGPSHEALHNWDQPATTLEEAILALQFAADEAEDTMEASELSLPMVRAALGYFKPEAGRFPVIELKIAC